MGRRRITALPIPMLNPQYGASSLSGRHGVQYWFGWLLVHCMNIGTEETQCGKWFDASRQRYRRF